MTRPLDPRVGRSHVAFPAARLLGWPGIVLGSALMLAGALLTVLFVADPPGPRAAPADVLAVLALLAMTVLGGVAVAGYGAFELAARREWHLCEHGAIRVSRFGAGTPIFWSEIPRLDLVERRRAGRTVGFALYAGRLRIFAPGEALARRGYDLWRQARAR